MSWVIQLRPAKDGVRYYTSRGKKVTLELEKAKRFATKKEAETTMATGTQWPARKVISYKGDVQQAISGGG